MTRFHDWRVALKLASRTLHLAATSASPQNPQTANRLYDIADELLTLSRQGGETQ